MTLADEPVPTAIALRSEVAPVVYFEACLGVRNVNGIISIELGVANNVAMSDGDVKTFIVGAGHLKGNLNAFASLRDAIDKALALGVATTGKAN